MYETKEEVTQKLISSVVMFDGSPVYLINVEVKREGLYLRYVNLPYPHNSMEECSAYITDPRWNFKILGTKLGYVDAVNPADGTSEVLFCSRMPVRHSRQGLDGRTVYVRPTPWSSSANYSYEWGTVISFPGLTNTMKGVFSKPKTAFDKLVKSNGSVQSVTVARKLALVYDRVTPPTLVYRNEKIGYTEDGEVFKLAKHKEFLKEELVDMEGLKIHAG